MYITSPFSTGVSQIGFPLSLGHSVPNKMILYILLHESFSGICLRFLGKSMSIMCQVQAAEILEFGSALLIGFIPKPRSDIVLVIISIVGGHIDIRGLRTQYAAASLGTIVISPITEWLLQYWLIIMIFQKQKPEVFIPLLLSSTKNLILDTSKRALMRPV